MEKVNIYFSLYKKNKKSQISIDCTKLNKKENNQKRDYPKSIRIDRHATKRAKILPIFCCDLFNFFLLVVLFICLLTEQYKTLTDNITVVNRSLVNRIGLSFANCEPGHKCAKLSRSFNRLKFTANCLFVCLFYSLNN